MAWCYVTNLVASASLPPPVIDPPSTDSSADQYMGAEGPNSVSLGRPLPDISTPVEGNSSIDLNGWRPLLNAQYTPSFDGIPQVTRVESEEQAKEMSLKNDGDFSAEVLPFALAFLGSVGGILGIFQFFESWGERIGKFINKSLHKDPHSGRDASWAVGIQVGLDTAGLKVPFASTLPTFFMGLYFLCLL